MPEVSVPATDVMFIFESGGAGLLGTLALRVWVESESLIRDGVDGEIGLSVGY